MKKFRFKKEPRETGLRAVGHPHANTKIKLDGGEVGWIHAPSWSTKDNKWEVWIRVKQDGENWANRKLKPRFDSEPEAREYLNARFEALSKIMYPLKD